MVMLKDLRENPWTTNGGPPAAWLRGVQEGSCLPTDQRISAALLQAEVDRLWSIQNQAREQIAAIEKFRECLGEPPLLGGDLGTATDAEILEAVSQLNDRADWALDELEPLSRFIRRFEQFRNQRIVWSADAERLLAELHKVESLYGWFEKTARQLSEQLCAEYLRRHPELPPLPIEAMELGRTNSARLPSVL